MQHATQASSRDTITIYQSLSNQVPLTTNKAQSLSSTMECLHIGTPSPKLSVWEMKTIYIHNFLELSKAKSSDNYVTSPNFECFGHKLILFVFPGGEGPRTTQDGWVVASIGNGSCANLRLDWKISLLCQHGSVVAELEEYGDVIEHMMTSGGPLFDRNELIQQILIIFTKELCVFK